MASLMTSGMNVLFGIIALLIAVGAIATTNSAVVGTLAWLCLGFVGVLMAVKILTTIGVGR